MSRRNQWALDFKQIEIQAFVDTTNITCDEQLCCREVLAKNPGSVLSSDDLLVSINTVRARSSRAEYVICGHDAAGVLSLVSGPNLGRSLTRGQIEKKLADCYEVVHFRQTSTFQEFVEWENRNAPYRINI
jgi:hypothetical protein